MIVAGWDEDKLIQYRNGGQADFGTREVLHVGGGARCIRSADLDGNGSMDLVVSFSNDGSLRSFLNDGLGSFQSSLIDPFAFIAYGIDVGDIDQNGTLDLLSIPWSNRIAWYAGYDDGSFSVPHELNETATGAEDIQTADLDLDGDQDVFAATPVDGRLCWYCLLYTSPSPRDRTRSRMPSSA